MKKAAKIIAGIVVFIAILVGAIFFMTSGMSDTATAFFTAIKEQDFKKAYSYLSEDFKASATQQELVKFLDKSALLKFRETSWSSRSVSGGKGELDGTVISDTGGAVPVKLKLIKENDAWKIYSIVKPAAGLAQKESSLQLPPADKLMKLADDSMLKFANSVNAGDFKEFHAYISNLWQKQFSVEKLNESYKAFINAKIDMVPGIKTNNPSFDVDPVIDEDGVLVLEGHYPTKPMRIRFKLRYIYEGVNWKLVGTNVTVK